MGAWPPVNWVEIDVPEEPIAVAVKSGVGTFPPVLGLADDENFGIIAEIFKMPFSSALPWTVTTMPPLDLTTIVTPSLGFQLPPLKAIASPGR